MDSSVVGRQKRDEKRKRFKQYKINNPWEPMSTNHYRKELMRKEYFSPAEVAELLGVTRETIYNGIRSGLIPSYKIGRLRRISEEQFSEALKRTNSTVI